MVNPGIVILIVLVIFVIIGGSIIGFIFLTRRRPQCTTPLDCPNRGRCINNTCQSAPTGCTTNLDCDPGLVCKGNVCTQCTSAADCDSNQICRNRQCLRSCTTNLDCSEPTPLCSSDGVCVPRTTPAPPPMPIITRIRGAGVTCDGSETTLNQKCGNNLTCSPVNVGFSDRVRGICVVPPDVANNPSVCGPTNRCNLNYICGDNAECLPAFIADPLGIYVIRGVSNPNPTASNVLTAVVSNDTIVLGVEQGNWSTLATQRWQFVYVPQGDYYAILSTAFPITLNTLTATPNLPLHSGNWTSINTQQFRILPVATQHGTYAIVNPATNQALSYNGQQAIGLANYNADQDINQRFIISQVT